MTLVTLDTHGLPDYLLAVFDQAKDFTQTMFKAKVTRNELRLKKDQQINILNAKVALPQATSFVTADLYQGKCTLRS